MAFPAEPTRTPTAIQDMEVRLISVKNQDLTVTKTARFDVQVLFNTGEIKLLTGNLIPHLTGPQITQLNNFMDSLRVQAEDQILP